MHHKGAVRVSTIFNAIIILSDQVENCNAYKHQGYRSKYAYFELAILYLVLIVGQVHRHQGGLILSHGIYNCPEGIYVIASVDHVAQDHAQDPNNKCWKYYLF